MNMLGLFPVLALGAGLMLNAATSAMSPNGEAQAQVQVAQAQPADDEVPADIIAVQIRKQGFACEKAQGAEKDAKADRPDSPVWILDCGNASYRVRLVPNMAAKVEKLD